MKKIFTFFFVLFILVYFFQLYRVAKNYSQSYRFGDEDAHMLAGHLILRGYKPYKDFSGNHQPIAYLAPATVEKIWPGNSLYLFVGRHRLAIFLYAILWQVIFLIVFGKFLLFFTLLFEICRYVLLGNKMLGEVLAMYPLIFLFGILIKKTMFNKKLNFLEIILFSFSTFLSAFSLLPLWPSIGLLNLLLMYSHRKDLRRIVTQLLPLFILISLLFFFVPINYYFRDAIYDNVTFVIPKLNKVSSVTDYIRMFFLPFTAFNLQPSFIHILMIACLFLYAMILKSIKQIKKIMPFLLVLLALLLTNNRNIVIKFGDFHVLPWLATFLFIPIVYINYLRKSNKVYIISFILLTTISVWINLFNKTDFYGKILLDTKNDIQTENYINYSRSVKYGLAIKTMKHDRDRLFGIANETLVFWVADLDLAIPPLESLPWQYDLPRNRKQLFNLFLNNPPEYFLMDPVAPINIYEPLGNLIVTNLKKNYIQLYHTGKPSELYVLKSRIRTITRSQLSQLKYYLFEVPPIQAN